MSSELTSSQRRALRARAHALQPVVAVGNGGLSDGVLRDIDRNLSSHELIKIRVADESREAREALMASVCAALGALPVQHIGKILVIYRENPELHGEQAARKSKAPFKRKGPRRTKRSFQH